MAKSIKKLKTSKIKDTLTSKQKLIKSIIVLVAIILLFIVFLPAISSEIKYLFVKNNSNDITVVINEKTISTTNNNAQEEGSSPNKIVPADNNFSIIVPKLGINAKIIANVDPFSREEYSNQLKNGVAHAKDSGFPDDKKNSFIFAHSSNNFYSPGGYSTVFELLYKLKPTDIFYLVYKNKLYKYQVTELKKVNKKAVKYLYPTKNNSSVTLMTCWPPGSVSKRLLVFGKLVEIK